MKIEKVNDRQIRCILTGEDLAKRQLKLSELAYGTEKARSPFRDMMEQAAFQYGFEADDSPLMIEAIPLSSDSIVLVVTTVDHPEELDTRFSNFAPSVQGSIPSGGQQGGQPSPFGRLMDSLRREMAAETNGQETGAEGQAPADHSKESEAFRQFVFTNRLFAFQTLGDTVRAASMTGGSFTGRSSLYHADSDDLYYLFLTMPDMDTVRRMQNVLAILSEYGTSLKITYASEQHLKEHSRILCDNDALSRLAEL